MSSLVYIYWIGLGIAILGLMVVGALVAVAIIQHSLVLGLCAVIVALLIKNPVTAFFSH